MKSYEIDVVLATLNGSKYLQELLDSIASQQYVKINLYASDDGSSDTTTKILKNSSNSFSQVKILEGPREGPAANFFALLKHTSADYVALADQDDVWNFDHLFNSIKDLESIENSPGMRFCALTEFGVGIRERIWPKLESVPNIEKLLVENPARGCTVVLNRNAVDLINSFQPKAAVMHDWWILLLISLTGKVIFSNAAEIRYRIHETNTIGLAKKRSFKGVKSAIKGVWPPMLQAIELFEMCKNQLSEESFNKLKNFIEIPNLTIFRKSIATLFFPKRFRTSFMDEIALRVTLILCRKPN